MVENNCIKVMLRWLETKTTAFLYLVVLTVLFSQCKNVESGKYKGMSVFVNDQSFQNIHDIPQAVVLDSVGKMTEFYSTDGRKEHAFLIVAPNAKKTLLVFHEWWGLNDNVKLACQQFSRELPGVNILAIDLYAGRVASNPEDAGKFMKEVTIEKSLNTIRGAIKAFANDHQLASIGWCFGGGWSLQSAIELGSKMLGCVIYYGMPELEAQKLLKLEAPVLGIFGEKDAWITPELVNKFDDVMKAVNKKFVHYSFPAEHAFANPSGSRYNEEYAKKANALAIDFVKKTFQVE